MLKNGFYNVIGAVIRMFLGVIIIPLLIKFLGIEEYGIWSWLMSIYYISMIAEVGISVSTTIFVSEQLLNCENKKSTSKVISDTIFSALLLISILGLIITIFLFLFSENISRSFHDSTPGITYTLTKSLNIIGLYVLFSLHQQVFVGVLQAYNKYVLLNTLKVMQFIALHIGFLIVAYNGGNAYFLTNWAVITMFFSLLSYIFFTWKLDIFREFNPRLININQFKVLLKYSGWSWIIAIGNAIFAQGDKFIVGGIFSAYETGFYAGITNIAAQINSISALPIQPILPFLSHQLNTEKPDKTFIESTLKLALLFNTIISLTIALILMLFGREVLSILIDEKQSFNNIFTFRIAVLIYAIYSLNAVGYYILLSLKKLQLQSFIILICGLSSLTLIYLLGKSFGINGAIWGNAGFCFTYLLTYFGITYFVPFRRWINWILPILVNFIICCVLIFMINPENVFFKVFLTFGLGGITLYFVEKNYHFLQKFSIKKKNRIP